MYRILKAFFITILTLCLFACQMPSLTGPNAATDDSIEEDDTTAVAATDTSGLGDSFQEEVDAGPGALPGPPDSATGLEGEGGWEPTVRSGTGGPGPVVAMGEEGTVGSSTTREDVDPQYVFAIRWDLKYDVPEENGSEFLHRIMSARSEDPRLNEIATNARAEGFYFNFSEDIDERDRVIEVGKLKPKDPCMDFPRAMRPLCGTREEVTNKLLLTEPGYYLVFARRPKAITEMSWPPQFENLRELQELLNRKINQERSYELVGERRVEDTSSYIMELLRRRREEGTGPIIILNRK